MRSRFGHGLLIVASRHRVRRRGCVTGLPDTVYSFRKTIPVIPGRQRYGTGARGIDNWSRTWNGEFRSLPGTT